MGKSDYLNKLLALTKEVEVNAAVHYLQELTEVHGESFVVNEVIGDFLSMAGKLWESGQGFSLAEAYVTSKIAQVYLTALSSGFAKKDPRKRVIIGNIKDDFQSSGRKLVIRFLEIDGWNVLDLGNDVAAEVFIETARREGIKFIGVSAMLYENAMQIGRLKKLLEREYTEEKAPELIVGGAIFTVVPDLAQKLGVSHTALNAFEAQLLFRRLYEEREE